MTKTPVDHSCRALSGLAGLDPTVLHKFVVGRDATPVELSAGSLNDLFSQLVLRDAPPPRTADEVVARLQAAVGPSDPRGTERAFLVGEGSQLPPRDLAFGSRAIRFVVALGDPVADVILSASDPGSSSVELMAWDASAGGFNFYRTGLNGAWVFGGNSADAFRPDTERKGPFESHTGGNVLMKELQFPWVHWHSLAAEAPVDLGVMDGHLDGHRWLRDSTDGGTLHGAEDLETKVVTPSITRWSDAHVEALRDGREPFRLRRLLEHLLATPTVNLVSSTTKRAAAEQGEAVTLPADFFGDAESLSRTLGLPPVAALSVPSPVFNAVNAALRLRLSDEDGFERPGDTFFAFVVPGRAFEDSTLVKALMDNWLSPRLVAALLMVDFANPIFSVARETLLAAVPEIADAQQSAEQLSETVAAAMLALAGGGAVGQFRDVWEAGDDWQEMAAGKLTAYHDALDARLAGDPTAAYRDWLRLAESRRRQARDVRKLPIFEFPLLLPMSDAPEQRLVMMNDGTVAAG